MSVTDILIAACSPDNAIRGQAEATLEQAKTTDLPGYLLALIGEVADETKPGQSRVLASTQLKNTIAFKAKDTDRKEELELRWKSLDAGLRTAVKSAALNTLASPTKEVRYVMAACIANIARMEMPANEWPTLIQVLTEACNSQNDAHVEAALTCLGYICEECDTCDALSDVLQHHGNAILNSIFLGFARQNQDIQHYATNAMCNAIDFVRPNMAVDAERDQIVQGICRMTSHPMQATRAKAMEALVRLGYLYYDRVAGFANDIWQLTSTAVRTDAEEVGLQAMLFWSATCEVEEQMEPWTAGMPQRVTHAMRQPLFELLCECLQKQVEGQTDEDWNLSLAASSVLVNLAGAIRDDIVALVMPFVYQHIQSPNWRAQDAACLAFGAILHGPEPGTIGETVAQAIPALLNIVSAPGSNPMVRDTCVWTLSVVALEFAPQLLQTPALLQQLMNTVGPMLKMDAALADRACTVIHNLCLYYDDEDEDDKADLDPTNELSAYYNATATALMSTIDRQDATESLRHNAQETLNMLLQAAALDTLPELTSLVDQFVARLNHTVQLFQSGQGNQELEFYQSLLCGALNNIAAKLKSRVAPQAPTILNAIVAMFAASKDGDVLNEALMCVGSVATSLGPEFAPHVPGVQQYILAGLKAHDQEVVCLAALGSTGQMISALAGHAPAFVDAAMQQLGANLRDVNVDRDLKPPFLGCVGDIALHTGPAFAGYLQPVFEVLQHFEGVSRHTNLGSNDDEDEFVCGLFEEILHCITGILQGFKGGLGPVLPYMEWVMSFVLTNAPRVKHNSATLTAFVGVIGDVANVLLAESPQVIAQAKPRVLQDAIWQAVQFAGSLGDEELTDSAEWTQKQLQALHVA